MNVPVKLGATEQDRHYLRMAMEERVRSDDPKAMRVHQSGVGAVVIGRDGAITKSANVLPPALKRHHVANGLVIEEADRYHFIEHAERAAIFEALRAGRSLDGGTIYCTRFPCSDCARAILWSGITRVVVSEGFGGEAKWQDAQRAALQILRRAGVTVRVLKLEGVKPEIRRASAVSAICVDEFPTDLIR
jgi:dCMP deaminase